MDFSPGTHMRKPHTRASNKLKIKYNLIANPKFRDLIINVEETPMSKEKAKKKKDEKKEKKNPTVDTK